MRLLVEERVVVREGVEVRLFVEELVAVRKDEAVWVALDDRVAGPEEVAVFVAIGERVAVLVNVADLTAERVAVSVATLVALDERVAESGEVDPGGEGANLPATAVAARCPSKNAPATVAKYAGLTCSPEKKRRLLTGACRFVRSVGELPRR